MSESSNINDPRTVSALLDQLKSSEAFRQSVTAQNGPVLGVPVLSAGADCGLSLSPQEQPELVPSGDTSNTSGSVAALLSQLQTPIPHIVPPDSRGAQADHPRTPNLISRRQEPLLPQPKPKPPLSTQELRSCTYQQALPRLAELSSDPDFVAFIAQMKTEQEVQERMLWEERKSIQKKYDEKVKVAVTRANMTGSSLSKHETDMLTSAFQAELRKFDLGRALLAWEGLVAKQQASLEARGVPTMFVTTSKPEQEGQRRVIQVLEDVLST